jgi:penicillin-binding protein 1A
MKKKKAARSPASIARHAGIAALFVLAAILGILSGILFAYAGDLPQISALDDYSPSIITRVYASDNSLIGEFATQRRVVVGYDDISPLLRDAIISAEDDGFNSHFGVSISRLFVTAIKDVYYKATGQSLAGASTLTQQLARKLFLTPEKSLERKVKEIVLTIQIEKRYTKREIFTLYCNQMNLGHGAYGVEAAAKLYFNKSAKNLTLEEAATIAGILQRPERQSPYVNMKAALRRRNYTLQRMAAEGYITRAQADQAEARPIVLAGQPAGTAGIAPYFVEEIRKYLEREYGARQLYESGLTVHTTLDPELQVAANAALDRGLRALDKRQGFRKPARNALAEGHTIDGFSDKRWERPIAVGGIVPAVVTGFDAGKTGGATLRIGKYRAALGRKGFAWTRRTSAAAFLKVGDLVDAEVTSIDEAKNQLVVNLEQAPAVEGAILAIDNKTGQVRAMVGGLSFAHSKFNRAVQASRQMGSTFKPIVFTAAIDRGYTPTTILIDEPATYDAGPGQPPYAPRNYDRKYEGAITLRRVLEDSRNVPTVKVMEQLGPAQVVGYARRMGFESPIQPYLSSALGAAEATLMEASSAYTIFPNQGVRMKPYEITKIVDREGNLLEEKRPEASEGIRADTAFMMVSLMRGVCLRGTAAEAAKLDWPIAGKTGTVDDNTDAWFIGYDPNITIGVWVGWDDKKPLGGNETGAVAALPIWMDVMKAYIDKRCDRKSPPAFEAPGNIVFVTVDKATGAAVDPATPGAINESFIAGTQPGVGFPRQ